MKKILVALLFLITQSVLAGAPPLILEPNKYSYTFGVPDGWEFNFEQARQFGAKLVFFPKGGSFHNSKSIIYVDEICKLNCSESLKSAMERIVIKAKIHNPNLKIIDANPVPIKSGGKAKVKVMTGLRDPRQVKEALAFIEQKEVFLLIVLTSKDTTTWEKDYEEFKTVVSGHKYFNCESSDLAVNCIKSDAKPSVKLKELESRNKSDVEKAGGKEYEMEAVHAFWGSPHFMKKCLPSDSSLHSPFTIFFEVLPSGGIGEIEFTTNTEVTECIASSVKKRHFSKPKKPFVVGIKLRFTK